MLSRLLEYMPALLNGAWVTLFIASAAIAVGFVGALLLRSMQHTHIRVIRWFSRVYQSFFRGTPMLVQLLILFYIPPALNWDINPYFAAIAALGMNSAAYQAEILRAGFQAIPAGHGEAASIMGLSPWQNLWYVQVPQVVRYTLPSLISEMGDIVKGSAIVSVITITDLMRVGRQLVGTTYRPIEVFVLVGLLYLVMVTFIQLAGRYVERRWKAQS
ncbi:amino acid ABC transporter permease [Lampropedia aestuarii]|uniref:amino acid ABC transporter permease n=1 Tax=Lampropedia aestuarii TaxID=2562762 RepID=UPI0024691A95|nr:amino acid ABC transporter permease [Lampropedia aestuarii]MDH5856597.1 amino acid ABC transporter permease [Lampropedia aestuarii]